MKRRWLLWLVVIGFILLGVSRFNEIRQLAVTLGEGQWQWILVAAALQLAYAVFYAALYQSAFALVQVDSSVRELLPVLFTSVFVNLAAPTTGAAGIALFADDATRRGQSAVRSTVGSLLVMIADFGTFCVVLVLGMAFLLRYHALQGFEVAAAGVLLLMTGSLVGILALGSQGSEPLYRLLSWLQALVNGVTARFQRPNLLPHTWAQENAAEFSQAAAAIAARPRGLLRALFWAMCMHLSDLVTVFVLFLAFRQPVSLPVLVGGYAMGLLFWIVSVTPSGIGVVEGVMTLTFTSLGVPPAIATLVVLTFRGLGFWLPVGIGFLLLRQVKSFGAMERVPRKLWSARTATQLLLASSLVGAVSFAVCMVLRLSVPITHMAYVSVRRRARAVIAWVETTLRTLCYGVVRYAVPNWPPSTSRVTG